MPEKPSWLPSLDTYIPGQQMYSGIEYQSGINRGIDAARIMEDFLQDTDPLSCLVIGAGINNNHFACSCEPYQIAAYLESRRSGYSLTIVDKSEEVIDDIRTRKKIVVPFSTLGSQINLQSWGLYLSRTGQSSPNFVHSLSDDVKFTPGLHAGDLVLVQDELVKGICVADIPFSFKEGLRSGQIVTVCDQIETLQLINYGQFDFISCTNILYLLNTYGQMFAMANIAQSLKPGGYTYVSSGYWAGFDPNKYTGAPLFSQQGGLADR